MIQKKLKVGKAVLSNTSPIALIAGPCVIENEKMTLDIARQLKALTSKLGMPFIFKASYDKANRSSVKSYRGPGIEEGLRILLSIKNELGVPVLTDVHCTHDVRKAAAVADILQIPAYLCRQTDLLLECARAGVFVNVKKGQFVSPYDVKNITAKIESAGSGKLILTERGAMFGYNNLVTDMRSLVVMRGYGYPVVFDATHSVQQPGGLGSSSGGQRQFIEPLALAAVTVGIAGIFLEVHPRPKDALSDGPNSVALKELPVLLKKIIKIDKLIKEL